MIAEYRGMLGHEASAQYVAIARLRCSMFMNGLRSIHGIFDLGAVGIAWMFYAAIGLGSGVGLCSLGYSLVSHSSWQYLPVLFWLISLLWLIFPMLVASLQQQSDLEILLRFPVSFGTYVLLHLISGLMEASTVVGLLCCSGAWLGIVIARPSLYLWAALSISVFAIFNILFVRAVFVWIDRWLAQRKSREILGAVFMVFVVSLLVIASVWNQRRNESTNSRIQETVLSHELSAKHPVAAESVSQVQKWLPPGLTARSLQQIIERQPLSGFASLTMLGLWVVLAGSALAIRLKAQYRGQNLSWAPSRAKAVEPKPELTFGGAHAFAAIVEKELRTLVRTVPLLWSVSVPVLCVFVFVIMSVLRHNSSNPAGPFPYAFLLCVAYALVGFTGLIYNNLGAEEAGIQLLFLSPTPIRTVFMAKNLLHSAFFAVVALIAGVLGCLLLGRVPPFVVLADTSAWLIFALPCNLAAGIIFSLTMPYRINPGRITRPAGAQANTFPAMFVQLGVFATGVLVLWICWSLNQWLPLPIFLAMSIGAFFFWFRVLHYADDNANQRRDVLIATLMKRQ